MTQQRKTFPKCSHRGYGQYCHLCKQIEEGSIKKTNAGFIHINKKS